MKIKVDVSRLPEALLIGQKQEVTNAYEAVQEAREKIRDWGKVHRGINNGKYGAPIFWTPERNAIVAQLRSEGKTFAEIGEELGKSKDAVRRQWYNIRDGRAQISKGGME